MSRPRRLAGLLRAARLHFSTSSTLPAVLGMAAAAAHGWWSPGVAVAVWATLLVGHAAMEVLDELSDFRAYRAALAQRPYAPPTAFSGGSGALTSGAVTAAEVERALAALIALFAVLAAAVVLTLGAAIVPYLLVGMLWQFGYSAPPLRLSSRGLGELGLLVCFGPLIGTGSYAAVALAAGAQSGLPSALELLLFLLPGLFQASMIHVQELFDLEEDRAAGKRTLVVRFGARYGAAAQVLGLALVVAGCAWLCAESLYWLPALAAAAVALLEGVRNAAASADRAALERRLARFSLYRLHGALCAALAAGALLRGPDGSSVRGALPIAALLAASLALGARFYLPSLRRARNAFA